MIDIYLITLTNLIIFATFGWILSLKTNNVTHVDSMWSIFFVIAILTTVNTIEYNGTIIDASLGCESTYFLFKFSKE